MKFLNNKEFNILIKGIENGDIIIDGRDAPKMTQEEIDEFKKKRQEHMDAMSPEKRKEIKDFVEKLRNDESSSL